MFALVVGHTERTPGAVNKKYNISEWQFNSVLAGCVKQVLLQNGLVIPPVINDNLPHYKEHEPVNKLIGIKAAVSFHLNAGEGDKVNYALVKYWHTSKKGKELSLAILNGLQDNFIPFATFCQPPGSLATSNRPDWIGRGASFLRKTTVPSVMLEPAFISCTSWLEQYLTAGKLDVIKIEKFAKSIAKGLIEYSKSIAKD